MARQRSDDDNNFVSESVLPSFKRTMNAISRQIAELRVYLDIEIMVMLQDQSSGNICGSINPVDLEVSPIYVGSKYKLSIRLIYVILFPYNGQRRNAAI
jgi:hypothetical protein